MQRFVNPRLNTNQWAAVQKSLQRSSAQSFICSSQCTDVAEIPLRQLSWASLAVARTTGDMNATHVTNLCGLSPF